MQSYDNQDSHHNAAVYDVTLFSGKGNQADVRSDWIFVTSGCSLQFHNRKENSYNKCTNRGLSSVKCLSNSSMIDP